MVHAHFFHQVAGFHVAVGEEHNAHQHRQQEDVHHIEHPGAAQDFHTGDQQTFPGKDFAVGQDGRETCQEHEDFGGIAEAEIAQGNLTQRIVWHVIPENEDQCQTAKKIDPVIAR
ncbi:hypothetical protein D3C76_735990 [compost metagenome]